MKYEIYDNEASLDIYTNENYDKSVMVMKHSVKRIGIVREDIIRIDTGNPLESVFIRHRDVLQPVTQTAIDLVYLFNRLISDCVCCDCSPQNPA
ncbi:MAG: hypothetical protein ABI675_15170 [Chitinophagaceae bacterium]